MNGPRVSIVSAVCNLIENGREDTFRQMFASVAAQSYGDLEHVIVDGGSTDGSVELIEREIGGHPNVIFVSEPDKGVYDAMNKGAALAGGDYLTFLNSDDYYFGPDGVARMARALSQSGADFGYGAVWLEKPNGQRRLRRPKMLRFLRAMPFCHQSFFLRRQLFLAKGGHDISLRVIADFKLVQELILDGASSTMLEQPFVTYRAGGISQASAKVSDEWAAVYKAAFSRFRDYPDDVWQKIARRRRLPLSLLQSIAFNRGTNKQTRSAAAYETLHTALAALSPGTLSGK